MNFNIVTELSDTSLTLCTQALSLAWSWWCLGLCDIFSTLGFPVDFTVLLGSFKVLLMFQQHSPSCWMLINYFGFRIFNFQRVLKAGIRTGWVTSLMMHTQWHTHSNLGVSFACQNILWGVKTRQNTENSPHTGTRDPGAMRQECYMNTSCFESQSVIMRCISQALQPHLRMSQKTLSTPSETHLSCYYSQTQETVKWLISVHKGKKQPIHITCTNTCRWTSFPGAEKGFI